MSDRRMYPKAEVVALLRAIDIGNSVAEHDNLLEGARVETSVFSDLLLDRVDLVPGTKGSGKSALYRIFVDFLAPVLLSSQKVVVAHGVQSVGDTVFQAFKDRFDELTEPEFVDFWCIYLVSLAHEQFVKAPAFSDLLKDAGKEVEAFRRACERARIPEIEAGKNLRDILEWALNAVRMLRPKATVQVPDGTKLTLELFGEAPAEVAPGPEMPDPLPKYIGDVKDALDALLKTTNLSLWLMVDRLDEIFPRRSSVETRALRGLLRTLRIFESDQIRVKVFLRDDILEEVVAHGGEGFTALTHITARQADTLQWSEDAILTLVTKRLFANDALRDFLDVDLERLGASPAYRRQAFYRFFPATVNSPPNQSETLRWIYSHTMDGRGVVTPRDVLDLLIKARQRQLDELQSDQEGSVDAIIGRDAIRYGHHELSIRKRDTLLQAELPHLWEHIEKLRGQKTEWTERSLQQALGPRWKPIVGDFVAVGLVTPSGPISSRTYKVPFLYRDGLELTQGRMP